MTQEASSAPKVNSPSNKQIFQQLDRLTRNYPLEKEKILQLLLSIGLEDSNDHSKLSLKIEKIFNTILMNILNVKIQTKKKDWQKQCGLPQDRISALKQILEIIFKSQQNKVIKRTLIITFIQNILECLGVSDLTQILSLISEQICSFSSSLEQSEQYKLLRIINHLLKRISKTEDYHIRGQLHFTLTRFLPICHDSGFHYRSTVAKASQYQKISPNQQELKDDFSPEISYEFYQQFWEMQTYFMDLNELSSIDGVINLTPIKNTGNDHLTNKLKKILLTLREVQKYFNSHQSKETSDYYNQPLKFLKNFKLLALQLDDPFFRKIIMIQTLIFTLSISNQTGKTIIIVTEADKKLISEIESIAKSFLTLKCGVEGRQLYDQIQRLFANQLYWIDLKDNWKDKKKLFFKKQQAVAQEEAKHKITDIDKKRADIKRQINDKMKIEGNNLMKFLQNKESISLQQAPSYTSFSYFYTQALSCFNSFDKQTGKQSQFQTRAQYNMFEWKAMRSLYRQHIRDMWSINDKCPPKMKQYRLISMMNKRQQDPSLNVESQPHKKIKQQ